MIKQLQATRTCSICGQKKPLVAFLELAGDKGHTYGDICATCRGTGHGRKKSVEEGADQSGGTTRLQIDSKTKVQLEHDKKEQAKEHDKQDYLEKTKKESAEAEKSSHSEQREEAEKKYREEYLESRKWGKISATDQANAADKANAAASQEGQSIQAQGFYQEKTRVTQDFQQQTSEQQFGKKTTGLTVDYVNKYVSATGRSAESLFGQVLGQFMRNSFRAHDQKTIPGAGQQKADPTNKAAASANNHGKMQTAAEPAEQSENTATEFAQNNFRKR